MLPQTGPAEIVWDSSEAPLGDAARDVVMRRLAQQVRRFPELDIAELETDALPARDAAFAHAIYDGVVRRWITLTWLLERHLSRPWADLDPKAGAALLAGASQLLLLDRVPPHAAINHAVEWAKRRVNPRVGGVINAVLRKVAALRVEGEAGRRPAVTDGRDELPMSDGTAIVLREAILPEDPVERLAIVTGTPIGVLRAWSRTMARHEVRRLALHTLALPPVILNTMHAQAPLPVGEGGVLEPHSAPGHHVFTGSRAQLIELLRSRDDVWVQDPASSLAVGSAAGLRAKLILDLCAGQGTKTRQLAAMFPEAEIVATDVDRARYETLAGVFRGHPRVRVMPAREVAEAYRERADLILLDVPCSNTGVLARRPEAKYRVDAGAVQSLRDVQRQIIADAIPLLRHASGGGPRGVVLYSTCSLEPEENEQQAAWAGKWHGFKGKREHRRLPEGLPGEPPHRYSDGSYALLLM